jgi:hypothetical protein
MLDPDGNKPKWWEWLITGLVITAGVVLCATGLGTAVGVGLLVAGGSMLAGNIMSASGVDGKVASIVSSALNIVAGVVLCFTPFAAIGASMIGAGVGGIAGGYISEALGGRFETGAMIGSIVGGIVGGQVYKGIQHIRAVNFLKASGVADPKSVLKNYKGGVEVRTLRADKTAYRVWGGDSKLYSSWVSPKNYGANARSLLALPNANAATNVSKFIIPQGAVVITGRVARLGVQAGGGIQWWIAILA